MVDVFFFSRFVAYTALINDFFRYTCLGIKRMVYIVSILTHAAVDFIAVVSNACLPVAATEIMVLILAAEGGERIAFPAELRYNAISSAKAEGIPQKPEHNDIRWTTVDEIPDYHFCPAGDEILSRLMGQ